MDEPTRIFIDPNYLALVPRPTQEQRDALKESLRSQGQLEPIIVSKTGKVLDGHTRFELLGELGIVPNFVVRDFPDEQAERLYAITSNLKRRQLNQFQIYELFEQERELLQLKAHETRKKLLSEVKSGKRPRLTRQEQVENSTDYKIGEMMDVSSSSVSRMAYIKRHGTKTEIDGVRKGEKGTDQVFRAIIKRKYKDGDISKHNTNVSKTVCKKCGSVCRKRRFCHVHKKVCCTQCEWGI